MSASTKDRSRAARLRRAVRAGRELSADDRAWLETYEASRSRKPKRSDAPPEPSAAPVQTAPQTPSAPPSPGPEPAPQPAEPAEPADYIPIPVLGPEEPEKPPEAEPAKPDDGGCKIPDCPKCKTVRGAQICATTGERVWPRMTPGGARAMASIILGIIGAAVRLFRADRQFIPPTKEERDDLAKAIEEVAYRRASWMGAFDDLLALGWALSAYGGRAMRAPSKERKPETAPAKLPAAA